MDRLPSEEGVKFIGPPVDTVGRVQKYELHIGNAESLTAMLEEYKFFTPAILYLYANFTDAPLIDFMYEIRQDVKLYYKKFNKPIFRGLDAINGDTAWNHALWAVENQYWDLLHDFLVTITLSDASTKNLIRIASQELVILDPLAEERLVLINRYIPRLHITAFGINGNKGRAAFNVGLNPLSNLPILRFYNAADDVKEFANAYYNGQNPVNARTNFITRKLSSENEELK